ncbi:MBL fold metallo-hydrolase [Paracoccus actinidiae]|uniref:MBL fold metallo-hydrolase n=1 Tax=Paracoccus actinidiae TaxID=3064531 RepID=UPI0027D1FDDE|nr:MBL fold metallo-hydrolase [Paracoccus sp. M09]
MDPFLADQGTYPAFSGTEDSHLRNPLVPLKTPMDRILDVDAVIVTHLHIDHWDEAAVRLVRKEMPIFVQNYSDAQVLALQGFGRVAPLIGATRFGTVTMTRTCRQHGSDTALEAAGGPLGSVCGAAFQAGGEPTLYLAGDTVWNDMVRRNLDTFRPEAVVLNAGDARIKGLGSIIMGKEDVRRVFDATDSQIVASHLEAANHCRLSRA